jgi:hypothetical protein
MIGPPKPGTLAEVLCLMVWKARQSEMIARTRAVAQAAVGGDAAVDAFSEFRDLINRVEIKDRNEKMRKQLERLKEIKEIRFKPLAPPKKATSLRTVSRDRTPLEVPEKHRLKPVSQERPIRRGRP